MKNKVGHFTITPLLTRNKEHAEEVRRSVEYLKSLNIPKKPASTIQCASTQRTLDRDPSLDTEWQNRPLPESVVLASKIQRAAYETGDLNELEKLLSTRKITPDEFSHAEAVRRRAKNSQGQSEKSSVSMEAIERAIHSFTYSPPAKASEITKEKLVGVKTLTPYESTRVEVPIVKEKSTKFYKLSFWGYFSWTVILVSSWFMLPIMFKGFYQIYEILGVR